MRALSALLTSASLAFCACSGDFPGQGELGTSHLQTTRQHTHTQNLEVLCWDDNEAGVRGSLGLRVDIGDVDASFLTPVTVSLWGLHISFC